METLEVTRITHKLAAWLLAGCERLDPRGMTTANDVARMAERGQCFGVKSATSVAVYVMEQKNGVAWVNAVQGRGPVPWSSVLLPIIEAQAAGCKAVAFQTQRRGVMKHALAQGYHVAGWILKKNIE